MPLVLDTGCMQGFLLDWMAEGLFLFMIAERAYAAA